MSLTPSEIQQIIAALAASDWDEAVVTVGDVRIAVGRNGAGAMGAEPGERTREAVSAPPAPAAPAAAPVAETQPVAPAPVPAPVTPSASAVPEGELVTAPSVGVFWQAPEPGAAPFVSVGSAVAAGDTLCIIEIMKLMSNVAASFSGTVTAIHVENGAAVQAGDALFTVRRDA